MTKTKTLQKESRILLWLGIGKMRLRHPEMEIVDRGKIRPFAGGRIVYHYVIVMYDSVEK